MKTPIPNLGTYKPKKGKKMIYCGIAEDLQETHPNLKFTSLKNPKPYRPEIWIKTANLFLTKKEWKRLNAEIAEKQQPKERDLSGVQNILIMLNPEVRERVIELASDSKDLYYKKYFKTLSFLNLFTWDKTREGHLYWHRIYEATKRPELRKGNPAFIQPFEWIKDRPPTKDDANDLGVVSYYFDHENSRSKIGLQVYNQWSIKGGLPWAPTSETAQFTPENPAPSPFEQ